MYIILIASFIIIMFYFYQRYFPVWYVPNIANENSNLKNVVYVDVRDYQDATHNPVHGALNLPYPYLKRHHKDINGSQVIVVASDHVLKNLSIRLLKGHGFNVIGYKLVE